MNSSFPSGTRACSLTWLPDGSGFYYTRYPAHLKKGEENYHRHVFFHKLGDEQSKDALVYERKDEKEWGFDGEVTEDGRYLVITIWRGTERKNQIFYKDLR